MNADMKERARAERDAGIAAAVDHADAVTPKWSHLAYAFLLQYAARNDTFTSEDVRVAAYEDNAVPMPPDQRAWGGVFARAVRAGLIRREGFVVANDPKVHCNNVALWRAL